MSMHIYEQPGRKIVFAHPQAGNRADQEIAKKYLKVGETYTVEKTVIGTWATSVYLKEVPKIGFNSMMFDEV